MKITMIAGSNREGATSTSLLRSIERLLKAQHLSVTFVDLRELPLPLYSPDAEALHPNVQRLVEAVADAEGLILATPEYHGSISGVLKNALDYMHAGLVAGKPVLSVSSAGGPMGVSSLLHLQSIVRNLHGVNSPEWISVGAGYHSFDSDGHPSDEGMRGRVESAVWTFVDLTRKLAVGVEAATVEQKNIELVAAFIEAAGNRSELDRTDQFFAEQLGEAFTDRHYVVDEILAQGEKVTARIVITGTHQGAFAGKAPTGRSVKITQFREFRVVDGQIAEHRGWFDTGTLLPQLQAN